MRKWKKFFLAVSCLLPGIIASAQSELQDSSNTSGFMRSSGKIYVVVAVVVTILAGLIIYVARLDRKISKMEKHG